MSQKARPGKTAINRPHRCGSLHDT
jgi:hypothetical protein